MALVRQSLRINSQWNRNLGTDPHKKFKVRKDRVLAIIVLAVEQSSLYMVGIPDDLTTVWNKLVELKLVE